MVPAPPENRLLHRVNQLHAGAPRRQHELLALPYLLRALEVLPPCLQPDLRSDRLLGAVVDIHVYRQEGRPVRHAISLHQLRVDPHLVYGQRSRCYQLHSLPDAPRVAVLAELSLPARTVPEVHQRTLDCRQRHRLSGLVGVRQRPLGARLLRDEPVFRLVAGRVDLHDKGVPAVCYVFGDSELERREEPFVPPEIDAVQPHLRDVIHRVEPQDILAALDVLRQRSFRRHFKLPGKPDHPVVIPNLGLVPVGRDLHCPPALSGGR